MMPEKCQGCILALFWDDTAIKKLTISLEKCLIFLKKNFNINFCEVNFFLKKREYEFCKIVSIPNLGKN